MITGSLEGFATRRVKKILLDATANLFEDTPRDLGWARKNWIPEIGPGPEAPAGDRKNISAATAEQQQGIAAIAVSYRLGLGIITITNNVPYIIYLNGGSSTQAPAGFVQAEIFRAVQGANKGGSLQ